MLVAPADNPAGIAPSHDLDQDGVDYVVCVDTAPCGKVAPPCSSSRHRATTPASEEVDVKAVLAKVTCGEADAGIVYVTDAVAAGDDVGSVEIPGAADQTATYPIAPLSSPRAPTWPRSSWTWCSPTTASRCSRTPDSSAVTGRGNRSGGRSPLGRPPVVLLVPAVLAAALLVVPLVALVLQTPWSDFCGPARHRGRCAMRCGSRPWPRW